MFGGIPFGAFPGMEGEMPGMGGRRRSDKPVDNTSLYKYLGIDKGETDAKKIKKAYRKKALKAHPDRGGDEETFKKIQLAYEVLSDPKKREMYDKYGEDALKEGGAGGGGGGAEDIFSAFFGGGGGRRRREPEGPQKGDDIKHPLKVTLEQLYNGRTCKIAITRDRIKYPQGLNRENAVVVCRDCDGRGQVMRVRQIGPGMIQQMRTACSACGGQGKTLKPGCKRSKERVVLEIRVEKGMKHGNKIVEYEQADEEPGKTPGNVVFIIQEKPHSVFKRKNADLLMEREVPLIDSLCGLDFSLTHLDGRVLRIRTRPGVVIHDQCIMKVEGEGMPLVGNPYEKGDLYIVFKVKFPESGSLSDQQCQVLRSIFGRQTANSDWKKKSPKRRKGNKKGKNADEAMDEDETDDDFEEHFLAEVDSEDFGKQRSGGGNAYDSDDEQGGQPRGVQCAQQ